MPTKHQKKLSKTPITGLQTYKEVLADYKTGIKEAKKRYLKKVKGSKFKKDTILPSLPDFILKKDFKGGIAFIMGVLKKQNIEVEELSLTNAKKRLSKGKKLTHKTKSKTILVPTGFSDRDHFNQLIILQHKYKLCLYGTAIKSTSNENILKTSLSLVVIAIKTELPRHLTENLYDRYMLSLEEL